MNALESARLFHDTYERLAPEFGYETRPDTKQFDPESPNGKLMIAVVSEILPTIAADREAETKQKGVDLQTVLAYKEGQQAERERMAAELRKCIAEYKTPRAQILNIETNLLSKVEGKR